MTAIELFSNGMEAIRPVLNQSCSALTKERQLIWRLNYMRLWLEYLME